MSKYSMEVSKNNIEENQGGLLILMYGAKGWIGDMMRKILLDRGHTVIMGKARLDNFEQLKEEISRIRPDRIFSSTGRTHGTYEGKVYGTIDYLELPGGLEKNIKDNLRGPVNLANICMDLEIHVTYMGTGCIFKYDDEHLMPMNTSVEKEDIDYHSLNGFTEDDHPNFFGSGYSTVKGQTDLLMHTYDNVLNCRIRMPISANNNKRNFITKITTYEKICSIPNSMTVLPEILPIMAHMLETRETGTYNMTNPGLITHNKILDLYQNKVDNNFKYQNFSLEEQAKILLSGRSNNYLVTHKLEKYCSDNDLVLDNIVVAVGKTLNNWTFLD